MLLDDGSASQDPKTIKNTWVSAFRGLLNPQPSDEVVEDNDIPTYPEPQQEETNLNVDISLEEINQALKSAKCGKAIGIDGLPVEVL